MHGGVLVQELLNGLAVDQHHLAARLVLVADVVVLQERGEVLRVATVCTGEGKEEVERPQIF